MTDGQGEVKVEPLHRYLLAREMCRGLKVMDVASGEGYGAALLAQAAESVIGVEPLPQAVAHAQREYAAANLCFMQGDARCLPAADASIDAVVSFETLEHFCEHDRFFEEVRRVLRPNGFLLVSMPDPDIHSLSTTEPRPCHVHARTHSAFEAALKKHFPAVAISGQRRFAGSILGPTFVQAQELLTFERGSGGYFETSRGVVRAKYLLGIAALRELPPVPTSVFAERLNVEEMVKATLDVPVLRKDSAEVRAELAWAGGHVRSLETALGDRERALQAALAARDQAVGHARVVKTALAAKQRDLAEARALEQQLHAANARALVEARALEQQLHAANMQLTVNEHDLAEANRMAQQLHAANARLDQVFASRSWRVSAPLRQLSERFPRLRRFAERQLAAHPLVRKMARRSLKAAWWTLTGQLREQLARRKSVRQAVAQPADPAPHAAPEIALPGVSVSTMPPDVLVPRPPEPTHRERVVEDARHGLLRFLASGQRIALRSETPPLISVLVVAWNSAYFTLKCLRALEAEMELQGTPAFEVIVFDNASSDETARLLAMSDGVKVVSSPVNLGFLRGCNEGAVHACGEALLLLNSDAFVRPGALRAAWDCLQKEPDIGAVGGRLVLTTGLLQEAGSVIWSDGSTLGYCRGMDPEADEAMFTREVGYCSGAFLLTPMREWRALSGFDERYLPAYYEEVDYCLRLREKGLRVLYEPKACADHFEFGSEGKNGDAVAQSIRNQKIFRIRHAAQLREFTMPPNEQNILFARTWSRPRLGRLLVIDSEVPFGALGMGDARARALLNAAADEGWDVTFFALHNPRTDWVRVKAEFRHSIEFIVGRTVTRLAQFLQERLGYYDTVVVSRLDNMRTVAKILEEFPHLVRGTRLIYDAQALLATRAALESEWNGQPVAPAALEESIALEISVALNADAVICVDQQEAACFRSHLEIPVAVLSHAVRPMSAVASFERRSGFVFVGSMREENTLDWIGLAWFLREVWPLILQRMPGATLNVVGHAKEDRRELMACGVRRLGPIADLSAVLAASRVFVAPIQFAAGISIQVLEAAAMGLPVLGAPSVARQLAWSVPAQIRTAETASAFADAAVVLHEDDVAWSAQSAAALARVTRENSEEAFDACVAVILGGGRRDEVA